MISEGARKYVSEGGKGRLNGQFVLTRGTAGVVNGESANGAHGIAC